MGGAGFASQRTVGDLHLDLASYDGIQLVVNAAESDEKKYTFILKDNILPRNPDNGREQSTISWEFDFEVPKASPDQSQESSVELFIPWHHFKATYRGKEKKGVPGPKLSDIRRLSVMMRRCGVPSSWLPSANAANSFFGSQEGEFQLSLIAIRALNQDRPPNCEGRPEDASSVSVEKTPADNSAIQRPGVWHWLLGRCGRL